MLALANDSGDPFSRSHFIPGHFTASAVILSPDRGALLLIYQSKLHRWLQPGGHVETEDGDLVATAQREVLEEVTMKVGTPDRPGAIDVDVHFIPARKDEPQHEHFDVRFVFHAESLDAVAGSDAKDFRWVPIAQVTEELTDASIMRVLAKLRRG